MLKRGGVLGRLALPCALLLPVIVAAGCTAGGSAPTISDVSPATIVPGQTRTLLIAGQGFQDGATVTLGGTVALPGAVWINDRYIATLVPGGIGGAGSQYSVVVTNPDRQQAVSPQVVLVGTPPATATPVPTQAASPTATRERPTPPPVRTVLATPTPTPTPVPTATAGPPVIIIIPPAQPPGSTETPSPTPATAPAIPPTQAPTQPSSPTRRRPGAGLVPLVPAQPAQPRAPGAPDSRTPQ